MQVSFKIARKKKVFVFFRNFSYFLNERKKFYENYGLKKKKKKLNRLKKCAKKITIKSKLTNRCTLKLDKIL